MTEQRHSNVEFTIDIKSILLRTTVILPINTLCILYMFSTKSSSPTYTSQTTSLLHVTTLVNDLWFMT